MGLNMMIGYDTNGSLGRRYNVSFERGRGRFQTFNNVLVKADNTYFWFDSKEDGLAVVRQDIVNFMYCTDSPRNE